MPDKDERLEWHLEGTQDFIVRLSQQVPAGQFITGIDEIKLQLRTGTKPEVWEDTGVTDASQAILSDDFDPDNPVPSAAVYWTATRDVDGDPVPGGGPYRWFVRVSLDTTPVTMVVAKPLVDLIP